MAIPSGKYTLRASPVDGVGGSYATGNGINEIVTVIAQGKSTVDRQVWDITAIGGDVEDTYTIILHTNGSTFGGSWSQEVPAPDSPIITSEHIVEWLIERFENGIANAITIQEITPIIGVTRYVGTNQDNQVVIKEFPPIEIPTEDIPYWQFKAHGD